VAQFFYDKQVRRFLIQFAKILSNWYVEDGYDPNGNIILKRVPVMYGDQSRNVANIISNNSPSNLPTVPQITYYVNGLTYEQNRTQDPYFVDNLSIRQRSYNNETQEFETTQGNAFSVKRLMPVPYRLSVTVDFWTSNYNQKMQLFEQLGVLFNPSLEIQSTDNFIDWTSLSVVYQESLNWTSRSIPIGTSNPIDIMTWKFYMPIWISSPIKVQKLGVIYKVINSIYKGTALSDMQNDELLLGTRQKVSPYGYQVLLLGNTLQILPANQPEYLPNDNLELPSSPNTSLTWHQVLNAYGNVRPGISMITLENPYMDTEIMGTITYDPLDDRLLSYNIDVDTIPANTLEPIDRVVDPLSQGPNVGLPAPTLGTRYLLTNDIGDPNTLQLLVSESGSLAAGATVIQVSGLHLAASATWVGSVLTGTNSSGQRMFSDDTEIVSINLIANTITINNPTIAIIQNSDIINTTTRNTASAWGDIVAYQNDIIEYNGTKWEVVFNSSASTTPQWVVNLRTSVQYRFGQESGWTKSFEGFYDQGSWNIVI
jgi:hypothetical protein